MSALLSRRKERGDPANQRAQVARLHEHGAAARELADQAFARKQERFEAANRAHFEIQAAVEGHDVAGVDLERAVDLDGQDAAIRVDPEVSGPAALE